jgi:hypothetical protein
LKKIAIVGSHGLYAQYGGWDQLVNNLAEKKSNNIEYLIFNSRDTPISKKYIPNVFVHRCFLKASGFEGLFFDFYSLLYSYFRVDTILLLGVQGLPIIPILLMFRKNNIISNTGGIEWERSKFSYFSKLYLRFCFRLSLKYSDHIIIDNKYFKKYIPNNSEYTSKLQIIPYGGIIDTSLQSFIEYKNKYPFLDKEYFLSVSRSIEDNMVKELCNTFTKSSKILVIVSNLSSSMYGRNILKKYSTFNNIFLIDGLYNKPILDLIRRNCLAYIHTHSTCGTAPSLVEMVIAKKPILSIDNPQNRFTLNNEGFFFKSFSQLFKLIESQSNFDLFFISTSTRSLYSWETAVTAYESLY